MTTSTDANAPGAVLAETEEAITAPLAKAAAPLLDVRGLHVVAPGGRPIIDGLTLRIDAGEVVALVGESGSGKSMTALSLVRLLPRGLEIVDGTMHFAGRDIRAMSQSDLNRLRGGEIAMLFQQPQAMLDPTSRVCTQIAEPLRLQRGMSARDAAKRVVELMRDVRIADPELRARAFSHELSGGMAQRVMIATAMGPEPRLLVADEPTTALDVTVQAQILSLMQEERRTHNLSILLITHDLTIVSAFADRVAVMYAGRIVEEGPTDQLMRDPKHPYTKALIRCSLLEPEPDGRLLSIPGSANRALDITCGCRFFPRCATAGARGVGHRCCSEEPALEAAGTDRMVRCHVHDEAEAIQ